MHHGPDFVQPLERRLLFVAFIVSGTTGDDVIDIETAKGLIAVTVNGQTSFANDAAHDAIDVRGLAGNDQITLLESGDNDILISGDNADGSGTGDDTIDIAAGNLDFAAAPTTIIGGGGNDHVRLNDQSNNFSDEFTFTATNASRFFFGGVTYSADLELLTLFASRGGSTINVNSTSPATTIAIDSGLGTDTINVNESSSPVQILPAPGPDAVSVNVDDTGAAQAIFGTQRIGALSIGSGGKAIVTPANHVLTIGSINVKGTGVLDLGTGSVIVDYPFATLMPIVQALITSGYNGGAWNGPGIIGGGPDRAVGFAEATDLFTTFPAMFQGQSVDPTSILLTHTRYGDADLNRTVDLADFNRLAANFGLMNRRWSQGDFSFNQSVDLADFNLLAANFGLSVFNADELEDLK